MNKLQWTFNRNSNIFIQENALENVVCEMASILSRPQCVKDNVYVTWYLRCEVAVITIWYYWVLRLRYRHAHYNDALVSTVTSQITIITIVYSSVYSGADQIKHQRSAPLAFLRGITRWQRASNAENVSIWCRHHGTVYSATSQYKSMHHVLPLCLTSKKEMVK